MKKLFKIIIGTSLILGGVASCGETTEPSNKPSEPSISNSDSSTSNDSTVSTPDVEKVLPETITFFSINDVHGALEENASGSNYEPGISKLDYAIKHDKDWDENSVLLSCGDMFQGTALSNLTGGMSTLESMNKMGIEAMCSGNHEFDWGLDKYKALADKADFPFLGINTFYKGTDNILDFTLPSTIIKRQDAKIGIIGSIYSTAAGSISSNQIKDIEFRYEEELVKNEAKRLKSEEDCDIVVLITHQGSGSAVRSCLESKDIDLAFGGHTHRIYKSLYNAPYFLTGLSNGRSYQKITLSLNEETKTYESVKNRSGVVEMRNTPSIQSNPEIDAVLDKYNEQVGPILNEKIGEASARFSKDQLGALACKSLVDYARNNGVNAVAAFHNDHGIRINELKAGEITVKDIYQMSPFDNEVRIIKMPGSELNNPSNFSGNYRYIDKSIKFDNDTLYDVVVFDFILDRAGFDLYKDSAYKINDEVKFVRDCIMDHIKANSPINPNNYR